MVFIITVILLKETMLLLLVHSYCNIIEEEISLLLEGDKSQNMLQLGGFLGNFRALHR